MPKPKPKKKPLTKELSFEHYARAIQTDIAQLSKSMTEGFTSIREEFVLVRRQLGEVREDVQHLNDILVSKTDLKETIRRELDASPFVKETDVKDIRDRLLRVEEKLGIKPVHRAA